VAHLAAEEEAVAPIAARDHDGKAPLRRLVEGQTDRVADDLQALPVPDDDSDRLVEPVLRRRILEAKQRAQLVHGPARGRRLQPRPLLRRGIPDVDARAGEPRVVGAARQRRRDRRLGDDDQALALPLPLAEGERRAGKELVLQRHGGARTHEERDDCRDAETHHAATSL
jgi:hypothetical protein